MVQRYISITLTILKLIARGELNLLGYIVIFSLIISIPLIVHSIVSTYIDTVKESMYNLLPGFSVIGFSIHSINDRVVVLCNDSGVKGSIYLAVDNAFLNFIKSRNLTPVTLPSLPIVVDYSIHDFMMLLAVFDYLVIIVAAISMLFTSYGVSIECSRVFQVLEYMGVPTKKCVHYLSLILTGVIILFGLSIGASLSSLTTYLISLVFTLPYSRVRVSYDVLLPFTLVTYIVMYVGFSRGLRSAFS